MINLFNINNYNIDTSSFSNLLHDVVVKSLKKNLLNMWVQNTLVQLIARQV